MRACLFKCANAHSLQLDLCRALCKGASYFKIQLWIGIRYFFGSLW